MERLGLKSELTGRGHGIEDRAGWDCLPRSKVPKTANGLANLGALPFALNRRKKAPTPAIGLPLSRDTASLNGEPPWVHERLFRPDSSLSVCPQAIASNMSSQLPSEPGWVFCLSGRHHHNIDEVESVVEATGCWPDTL